MTAGDLDRHLAIVVALVNFNEGGVLLRRNAVDWLRGVGLTEREAESVIEEGLGNGTLTIGRGGRLGLLPCIRYREDEDEIETAVAADPLSS
jgi:hypothetical protein